MLALHDDNVFGMAKKNTHSNRENVTKSEYVDVFLRFFFRFQNGKKYLHSDVNITNNTKYCHYGTINYLHFHN